MISSQSHSAVNGVEIRRVYFRRCRWSFRFAIGRWRQEGQNYEGKPQGGGRGRGRKRSASLLPRMPQALGGIVMGKQQAAAVAKCSPEVSQTSILMDHTFFVLCSLFFLFGLFVKEYI